MTNGTRRGWGVSITPRSLFTHGKDPVPIVQEAGWAPGPVWTGAENLAPTGIRSRTVHPVASRYNAGICLFKIKSKRIPSIFNDESTESFICLRRPIDMSHVNKVQPIRVKMIYIAAIRVTCMKDFVSVVKILLKAFFFCSLFSYPTPPHQNRASNA
jgi:hypothetical protein